MSWFTRMGVPEEPLGDLVEKAGGKGNAGNVEALAQHFAKEPHPFAACMAELGDSYDPETAKAICGKVKSLLKADS